MKPVMIQSNANSAGHYVPGMISRGMLYVSGQLPVDHESGTMTEGGIAVQTAAALRNVERVLSAAGASKKNVVLCRVYISDISHWDTVNRIYADYFGDHKPARVIVPTTELHHGALVEIEAIAEMADSTED